MENEYRKKLPERTMLKEVSNHQLILLFFFNFVGYFVEKEYPQCNLSFCIRNLK